LRKFARALNKKPVQADALLMCGDISDRFNFRRTLEVLRIEGWAGNTWFVTGNHDYYEGSFLRGDGIARDMTEKGEAYWLDHSHPILLSEGVYLVGTSTPYDMRAGIGRHTDITMADFYQTDELKDPVTRLHVLRKRADLMVNRLKHNIQNILLPYTKPKTIIIASHVSPWASTATFRGLPTDNHVLACYVCEILGQAIENYAIYHSDVKFLCLHGHTHGHFKGLLPGWPLENIYVMCGAAQYGHPKVHFVLDTEQEWAGARMS
jgi:calcineurin-like phosphoesterase family protein